MNVLASSVVALSFSLSSGMLAPAESRGQSGAPAITQPDVRVQPAGPSASNPVIHVSATGEVQRKPDYAVVFVGVELRDPSAQKAADRAGNTIKEITKAVEALKNLGVQIQTSEVRLNAAYKWNSPEEQRKFLGYDASTTIKVRVEDPKAVGKIMDAAITAGANRIDGVSFEINQALEARQEALRLAARAAKEKADTLASALDLRLGGVIEATTDTNEPRSWMSSSQTSNLMSASQLRGGGDASFDGAIEPGLVTVRSVATVTFAATPR